MPKCIKWPENEKPALEHCFAFSAKQKKLARKCFFLPNTKDQKDFLRSHNKIEGNKLQKQDLSTWTEMTKVLDVIINYYLVDVNKQVPYYFKEGGSQRCTRMICVLKTFYDSEEHDPLHSGNSLLVLTTTLSVLI